MFCFQEKFCGMEKLFKSHKYKKKLSFLVMLQLTNKKIEFVVWGAEQLKKIATLV